MTKKVEQFYDENADREWRRLDEHRTEFAVTMRALIDHLPPAPATIIDIGGGPGRYAMALSALGFETTLLDLSEGNVEMARQKSAETQTPIHHIEQANALDLSAFAEAAYDGALLLGPLYHLLELEERQKAVQEAKRLIKPGGLIFAAIITRFAGIRDAASGYPEWVPENIGYMRGVLADGKHRQQHLGGFTDAYFAHPDELVPLLESAEFETIAVLGVEGVVAGHESNINKLSGDAWDVWVELNYQLGHEPSLYGAADHLLYIGRKR